MHRAIQRRVGLGRGRFSVLQLVQAIEACNEAAFVPYRPLAASGVGVKDSRDLEEK
jgi:hypothetical protein